MRFHHLDYDERTPVDQLGPAAIESLLARGDLADWAPLARQVERDPHGALAGTILRITTANPMYGTSRLWTDYIEGLRGRPDGGGADAQPLATVRRARGLTQAEVGERLGISQSDVSKLERRSDVRVSTLRDYLAALGLRLRLVAEGGADEHTTLTLDVP